MSAVIFNFNAIRYIYTDRVRLFTDGLLPAERERQSEVALDNLVLSLNHNYYVTIERLDSDGVALLCADAVFRQDSRSLIVTVVGTIFWEAGTAMFASVELMLREEFDQKYAPQFQSLPVTEYEQERDGSLLSMDESKIRAYCKRYGVQLPPASLGTERFWAEIHFHRENSLRLPLEERQKSKHWLDERGLVRSVGPNSLDETPSTGHGYEQPNVTYVQPVYNQDKEGVFTLWLEIIQMGKVLTRIDLNSRVTTLDDAVTISLDAAQRKTRELADDNHNPFKL